METAIWIISIIAVIAILILYVITSVGSYSNSFVKRLTNGKKKKNGPDLKEKSGLD